MGYKVIFAPQAIERLEEIVRYIAQENPSAAEKFGLHLVDQISLLADFPELGRLYRKRANVRRLWCKPYSVSSSAGVLAHGPPFGRGSEFRLKARLQTVTAYSGRVSIAPSLFHSRISRCPSFSIVCTGKR